MTGPLDVGDTFRVTGGTMVPTTGAGIELWNISDVGYINAYDRGGSAFLPLQIGATTTTLTQGPLLLSGGARVWRDMVLVPSVVKLPGTNPPSAEAYDNFSFHRYDKATEESVYYTWAVPHDFAVGDASLKGHYAFIISHPPVAGGNLNVRMGFEYKKISEGDVFSFTSGTTSGYIDETIVEGETAWTLHITADGTCTTTGWATDDIILFRFFRKAADAADTYDDDGPLDNDVWVKNYHLAYLSDKLGTAS